MANIIKAKRSAVPGKVPATTDLALGEIGINTYDGKAYIKKDVGGVGSIVPLGGTGSGDVTGPNSATDNAVTRFDTASGKAVQNSSVTLDDNGNFANVNAVGFDTTPGTLPTAAGSMFWDAGNGSPSIILDADVTLQLGQEQLALVYNGTGSTIQNGKVVAVTGAQGARPSVALADADSEALSASTLGIATENIANGAEGFVTTFGFVRGLDTSAFTAGAPVYLSQTAGSFTATRPSAPAHTVALGWVIKVSASAGEIFVNINNGWELDELHNVLISAVANNEALIYNSTQGVWKNTALKTVNGTTVVGSGNIDVGDLDGPASATDNAITRFDGTTGKLVQNSSATLDDSGNLSTLTSSASGTGANKMPVGTNAQRPAAPQSGMYRMNSQTNEPEWYDSVKAAWIPFRLGGTVEAEVFYAAGGGGGGVGGGGGGGVIYVASAKFSYGTTFTYVIGAGGAGDASGGGGSTTISGGFTTAIGGGCGGYEATANADGYNGGSGGGGGTDSGGTVKGNAGLGTAGQGNNGGTASITVGFGKGGGGGAASVGQSVSGTTTGGNGGGAVTYFGKSLGGGGGGGSSNQVGAVGGTGGTFAGNGGSGFNANGGNATANSGGGGGGSSSGANVGGNGGGGVIFIRYPGSVIKLTGGSPEVAGGYVLHTYSSSGTFTVEVTA